MQSSHGTRSGQLLAPKAVCDRLGLSEREAEAASLVAAGASPAEVARRLGIATSTAAKHLASLRRKLGVTTTAQAALELSRQIAEPKAPNTSTHLAVLGDVLNRDDRRLAGELAAAPAVETMLQRLLGHLEPLSIRALFYAFLPLGLQTLRTGGVIERQAAPPDAARVHESLGGALANPFARRLLADPAAVVHVDAEQVLTSPDDAERRAAESMLRFGFRRSIVLGHPFGAGYAGIAALCPSDERDADPAFCGHRADALRRGLLLLQNAAFSFGALAATADLTMRERDALSHIAGGSTHAEAAEALRVSTRAVQKLLHTARQKLGARTTAEAVCLAMALNAVVFE